MSHRSSSLWRKCEDGSIRRSPAPEMCLVQTLQRRLQSLDTTKALSRTKVFRAGRRCMVERAALAFTVVGNIGHFRDLDAKIAARRGLNAARTRLIKPTISEGRSARCDCVSPKALTTQIVRWLDAARWKLWFQFKYSSPIAGTRVRTTRQTNSSGVVGRPSILEIVTAGVP
jgi:hypothetical protein